MFDSNRYRNGDIFRMPVGGGTVDRLTTDPAEEFAPDLSPDGRELAYHSFRSGTRDIFIKPIDGGPAQQITSSPSQESYPSWSPDGRAIAYLDQTREAGVLRGLFIMRRDERGQWSAPVGLRRGMNIEAVMVPERRRRSPTSRRVPSKSSTSRRARRASCTRRRLLTIPAPAASNVSDDGATIYFKSHDAQQRASFWSVPAAGGRPTLLVRFTDPLRESVRRDFAAGAGQFFFTLEDRQADIWIAEVLPPRGAGK